jgi:hypothetical protein
MMNKEEVKQAALRRWPSANAFYHERDNRTLLEVANLANYAQREIEIRIDPSCAGRPAVQAMALLAANLTARWARNVRLIVPEATLCPQFRRGRYHLLAERIEDEMRMADPFGNFQIEEAARGDEKPELRLLIGAFQQAPGLQPGDYVINAVGWSAVGRRGRGFDDEISSPATMAAAGLVASLGVADLFKRAIGHPRAHWLPEFSWSTWSHRLWSGLFVDSKTPAPPPHLDLGETLLAGVGAVGSAFLYLADLMPLRGALTLLDRDQVETSNLNRSPMFKFEDALAAVGKTAVARSYLAHQDIRTNTVTGTWHEHSARMAEHPFDVWISLTNEDAAWAEVPFLLPPVVLQATTTSGWGMGAGRHIPRREDCTLCRLPRPEARFRGPCAEGNVAVEEAKPPVQAALPLLSAGAASLLLAEYLKLEGNSLAALPNEVGTDLRYGLRAVIASKRAALSHCRGCAVSQSRMWQSRGGRGRFAYYSLAA